MTFKGSLLLKIVSAIFSIKSFLDIFNLLVIVGSIGSMMDSILITFSLGTSCVNFFTYSVAGFKTILSGVSNCSIIPSFIIAILSANRNASSKS